MSAKMTTLGVLKINVIWNKDYDVIICLHGVTNKILSRDSSYIVDLIMEPKFGNSSIRMREVVKISILRRWNILLHTENNKVSLWLWRCYLLFCCVWMSTKLAFLIQIKNCIDPDLGGACVTLTPMLVLP